MTLSKPTANEMDQNEGSYVERHRRPVLSTSPKPDSARPIDKVSPDSPDCHQLAFK
jgi:hypothetical protein